MSLPPFRLETITEHQRGLSKLAASLLSDWHGGEDLAQEAVLRALGASQPPRGIGWFKVSIQNLAWNEQRSRSRRRGRDLAAARPEAVPSSSEIAERAELARMVQEAIQAQRPEYASVLRDHYIADLSLQQISERDGVSLNTVKSRLRRAKEELRLTLEQSGLGEGQHWSVGLAPLALSIWPQKAFAATGSKAGATVTLLLGMKKFIVAVSLLILGAVMTQFVMSGDEPSDLQAADWVAPDSQRLPSVENASVGALPAVAVTSARQAIPAALVGPSTQLVGKVLDFDGRPLSDVEILMTGRAFTGRELVFEESVAGTTNGKGEFDFRVPFHAKAAWQMAFTPDAVHQPRTVLIGSYGPQAEPSLELGTQVMDPVILMSATTASGRVVDGLGNPLEGVSVRLLPVSSHAAYALIPESQDQTDAEGRFRLVHIAPGIMKVKFTSPGYASQYLANLEVAVGQEASLGLIELTAVPPIRGQLVDENGAGVPNQKVELKPAEGGGPRVSATTGPDGSFAALLQAHEPHIIKLSIDGYEPLSPPGGPDVVVMPGALDARLELIRAEQTEFHIVDADTGEPIEQYWLRVLRGGGSKAPSHVTHIGGSGRQQDWPGGVAVTSARPGVDLVKVDAEGYLPVELDVSHQSSVDATQQIALGRGQSVAGAVEFDGAPVVGAWVVLNGGGYPGRGEMSVAAGDSGEFTFAGLGSGQYRITARDRAGRRGRGRLNFSLSEQGSSTGSAALGLDVIELQGQGSVTGLVELPTGVSAEGLSVAVVTGDDEVSYALQPDRTFWIPRVDAGAHELQLSGRSAELSPLPPVSVTVERSKTASVHIDASSYGGAMVNLDVRVPGIDSATLAVEIIHNLAEASLPRRGLLGSLPNGAAYCAADGSFRQKTRASGRAGLALLFPGRVDVLLTEPVLKLTPGAVIEEVVRFHAARLELTFPESIHDSSRSSVLVELRQTGFQRALLSVPVGIRSEGAVSEHLPPRLMLKGDVALIEYAPPGSYDLVVHMPSGTSRTPVMLTAGETTAVTLRNF